MEICTGKYRPFYSRLLKLALPIMAAQIGYIAVQLADAMMVGKFGGESPLPLSAVSFATNVGLLFFFITIGIPIGFTPLVGERFVQNRTPELRHYLNSAMLLFTGVGVAMMLLQLASVPLLYHLGQPVEVVDMAVPYYRLMAYALPFVGIYAGLKQFLEGIGNTSSAMAVAIVSNLLNVFLNWVLIFGHLGFDQMGVVGAGVATFSSRVLNPILLFACFVFDRRFSLYLSRVFSLRRFFSEAKSLFAMGLPVAMQMVLEMLAFSVTGVMMGWFGAEAISASQIMTSVGNASFMIIVALGSSTTILVSHCYGKKDFESMRMVLKASSSVALVWGVFVCAVFISLRHLIPGLFTDSAQVQVIAAQLILVCGLYQISDAMQGTYVGALRGMKDVRIIGFMSFVSYILLNIPFGYLLGFTLGLGPQGLTAGYFVGLSAAALFYSFRSWRNLRKMSSVQ